MNTNKYSSFLQDVYHFNSSRLITPHFDKNVKNIWFRNREYANQKEVIFHELHFLMHFCIFLHTKRNPPNIKPSLTWFREKLLNSWKIFWNV